jgi:nucleoside-diphosphate-sugar epimerase
MKVMIFGASGFAGRALAQRLHARQDLDIVAAINSDGNAWSLAKDTTMPIQRINILDKTALKDALVGVTHVVNCTRGSDDVMVQGFKNLVSAALASNVQQFVHLSSLLIYGDRPVAAAKYETATPDPQNNAYGRQKLWQDNYLQSAVKKGLKATIICPPNIIGPGSYFVDGLLNMLRNHSFALLGDGDYACVTADVNNVATALELALRHGDGTGRRYFVTDGQQVTWRMLVSRLTELLESAPVYQTTQTEIEQRIYQSPVSLNPLRSLRHLVSSDVREALRKDPLLCKLDVFFRGLVAKLPGGMEDKIRLSVEGHTKVSKIDPLQHINWNFCAAQLRNVYHSSDKLNAELGYIPEYSFDQSMDAYIAHYRYARGLDTDFAALLQFLK